MMRRHSSRAFCLLLALAAAAAAQQPIPVRHLTDIVATDSGVLGNIFGIRGLPRGRVLVNDIGRHRLIVFDSGMKRFTVTTDSVPGATNAYGSEAAFIMPYIHDSTLFVVQHTSAFIVLDPLGRLVRTIAPPNAGDFGTVQTGAGSRSPQGYDPEGRLVYSTQKSRPPRTTPAPLLDAGTITVNVVHDSTPIVRVDPVSHAADTVAWAANAVFTSFYEWDGRGANSSSCITTNPLPQFDQWTLLPDGTVAIVRSIDYHIDWIHDGKTTSTPKMPFDWRRVTDADKQALLDSAHRAYDERLARMPATPTAGVGGVVRQLKTCAFIPIELDRMPDYYPPNQRNYGRAVFADRAGNVWILPSTSLLASQGPAYDVVNRKGQIFERVIIPAGRTIAGFGADGIVYLESRYGPSATRLERGRVSK